MASDPLSPVKHTLEINTEPTIHEGTQDTQEMSPTKLVIPSPLQEVMPSVSDSLQALREEREKTRIERINQLKRRRTQLNKKLSPDLIQAIPALYNVISNQTTPLPQLNQQHDDEDYSQNQKQNEEEEKVRKEGEKQRRSKSSKEKHHHHHKSKHEHEHSSSRKERSYEKEKREKKDTREFRSPKEMQLAQSTSVFKNDYSQHFVDTNQRPQNFIRDANLHDRFEEYVQ